MKTDRIGYLIEALAVTGIVVCGIAALTIEPAAALALPFLFLFGLLGWAIGEPK